MTRSEVGRSLALLFAKRSAIWLLSLLLLPRLRKPTGQDGYVIRRLCTCQDNRNALSCQIT